MEAAGIGGFVIIAGILTIFFEHPSMPPMQSGLSHFPILRRALLGLGLGLYVGWAVQLFGKLSGTHINPSVTLAFSRLGYISRTDAFCYIIAQFAGALIAFYALKIGVGNLFSYPAIDYGVAKPQPPHTGTGTFIAEFIISFILMISLLLFSSSKKLEKYTALLVGGLIALFITFELPYSGMSMNPARSFAAAFGVSQWHYLWIYFVSPTAATFLAAEIYVVWRKRQVARHKKDFQQLSHYPIQHQQPKSI